MIGGSVLKGNGRWIAGALGIFAVALGLRLWGIRHGLPYVYNADENSHFVPRAIGMFGHSPNPNYFINPPAYTYVLYALFKHALTSPSDSVLIQVPPPGFERVKVTSFYSAYVAC